MNQFINWKLIDSKTPLVGAELRKFIAGYKPESKFDYKNDPVGDYIESHGENRLQLSASFERIEKKLNTKKLQNQPTNCNSVTN